LLFFSGADSEGFLLSGGLSGSGGGAGTALRKTHSQPRSSLGLSVASGGSGVLLDAGASAKQDSMKNARTKSVPSSMRGGRLGGIKSIASAPVDPSVQKIKASKVRSLVW